MITNFKLYENQDNKKYWYINGDRDTIIKILLKYRNSSLNEIRHEDIYKVIYTIQENPLYKKMFGLFLGYSDEHYDFWPCYNQQYDETPHYTRSQGKNYYTSNQYSFEGELKLVNGEIFLDDFEVETDKYNL